MNKNIVAIINQKGGVGKTTTAINFAAGLAMRGKEVLLIDLDPQAHASVGLGFDSTTFKYSAGDVMAGRKGIKETAIPTKVEHLFIVPSLIHLDKEEMILIPKYFKESLLKKALSSCEYDYVIIDCRPTLGVLTINALCACNFIIVPCDFGRYALEGLADLMETVEEIKNGKLDIASYIRILLTKYDPSTTVINKWVLEQLEPYKNMVFSTYIRHSTALQQAQVSEASIFEISSRSGAAHDYNNLIDEFLSL